MSSLTDYDSEAIDKFSKRMLDNYGRQACEAAEEIHELSMPDSTINTYKPQIRQVLHECGDTHPDPQRTWDVILNSDKSSSTKTMMVSAMAKYYEAISEPEQTAELRDLSKSSDTKSQTENKESDYITRDELDNLLEHILPENDTKTKTLSFRNKKWVTTLQHKALILMLYHTTCDVGEICKQSKNDECLKIKDIEEESNQIRIYKDNSDVTGYKRKPVVVPQELIDALTGYVDMYTMDEEIFDFTVRTAQNRLSDISELYEYVFGEPDNAEKITPSVISRSKSRSSSDKTQEDKLTEIYNLLEVQSHDEAVTKIQNNLN